MDYAALQRVIDAASDEAQRVYGVFDSSRAPALEIKSIEHVQDIALAVSPDCSYRLVRDALAEAHTSLDIYIYNATAAHLLELVTDAKQRGVAVRLMYDVMDTRGDERAKLAELGVVLREAPSSGRRKVFTVCHQKLAVIDAQSVLLGSANWAASAIPKIEVPGKFKKGNREWLVHVRDRKVARFFQGLFDADWGIEEMQEAMGLAPAALAPPSLPVEARAAAVTIPDDVLDVDRPQLGTGVTVTPILSPDNYFTLVRELIRGATTSIDIEQQYIVAGGPATRGLLEDVAAAKQRGVTLRIIVSPAFADNWRKTIDTLTAAGVVGSLRALNLDSFTHLHNKGILVDGRYTVVTSTNLSENSITQAREAGLLIDSTVVARYYGRAVDVDWDSGIDPVDVSTHLTRIAADAARVEESTISIHPADARMI